MQNNVSTKLVTLDLDVILANYTNPKFWKKTWTIFKRPQYSITANIQQIDIELNRIVLKLHKDGNTYKLPKAHKETYCCSSYECVTIPIDNPEYTKENFKRQIVGRCLEMLEAIERHLIWEYAEYKKAEEIEDKEKEVLKLIAEEFLDKNDVSNDNVREAYIDAYVEENKTQESRTDKVIENYMHTLIGNEYLILLSYLDDMKRFNEYKKKCTNVRKSTVRELWIYGRKLNSKQYKEDMIENLEEI